MLNIVVSIFELESEALEAITDLECHRGLNKSIVSEAILVDKQNGHYKIVEKFAKETDLFEEGIQDGLTGMLIGIIGGPVGMLLGAEIGAFIGITATPDNDDKNISLLEDIIGKLADDTIAVIALASEEDESEIDTLLSKYKTTIARFDAAVVEQEVEKANDLKKEMQNLAKQEVRKQKKEEHKAKVEERRNKMKARFEAIKKKI